MHMKIDTGRIEAMNKICTDNKTLTVLIQKERDESFSLEPKIW